MYIAATGGLPEYIYMFCVMRMVDRLIAEFRQQNVDPCHILGEVYHKSVWHYIAAYLIKTMYLKRQNPASNFSYRNNIVD